MWSFEYLGIIQTFHKSPCLSVDVWFPANPNRVITTSSALLFSVKELPLLFLPEIFLGKSENVAYWKCTTIPNKTGGGGDTLAVNKRHQKGKGEEKRELRSEERDRRELGEEGMRRKRQKRNNNQEKREVRMGRKLWSGTRLVEWCGEH